MPALTLKVAVLAVVLSPAACSPEARRVRLEPRWEPLEWVQEDRTVQPFVICASSHTAYVRSLDWWLSSRPLGSIDRDGDLTHERVHCVRSLSGRWGTVSDWLWLYNHSDTFRLEEEQAAYTAEIEFFARPRPNEIPNLTIDPALGIARSLSGPLYGHIISYNDAYQWAEGVYQANKPR